jgi:hypothetical protein
MALTRTVTAPAAGDDGTATWAGKVYNDVGSIINYRIVNTVADGATITFDMNTAGIHKVVLGGTGRNLAISNVADGQSFIIILQQDSGGSRTVNWWSGILWPYNVTPTLTTTLSKYDVFGFTRIGSSYLGYIVAQNL